MQRNEHELATAGSDESYHGLTSKVEPIVKIGYEQASLNSGNEYPLLYLTTLTLTVK